MAGDTVLRIGELSRRSGVTPELLRAWERRYGLLRPLRSPGGLRLYSLEDLERVLLMRRHLAEGLAAAEAAALAARADLGDEDDGGQPLSAAAARAELADALARFDEAHAHAILDQLLATVTLDTLLDDVVLPYLHELGERWERGEVSVAQEHFASSLLRGRMLGLARGWGRGLGPLALLACLPGEQHELGLIAFGLALHGRGWRVSFLGSETPLDSLDDAARSLGADLVVLSTVSEERVRDLASDLRRLARRHRLAVGGAGASAAGSTRAVITLTGGPVAEAERMTALLQAAQARQ
jgi:DNA-binding transcriptional MerR regulator